MLNDNPTVKIQICNNGHHFIGKSSCPFCFKLSEKEIDFRIGDCIHCGQLCQLDIYCCDYPKIEQIENIIQNDY